jgi:predicted ATPase
MAYSLLTDELIATMKIAKRMHSLAQEQNDSTLMIAACSTVGATHYYLGNFEIARQYITRALRIWRSGGERFSFQEVDAQSVGCLSREALLQWHFGAIGSCNATMAKAISLAKDLNHMHGLAVARLHAGILACLEHNPAEVERLASELIELSTRQNFVLWLAGGAVLRGWARSVSGSSAQGLSWIEDGLADLQAIGAILFVPFYLGLKAEALHLADRTSEALEAIREAEALVERTGGRYMSAELHRLRGMFLVALGADEPQIEASFRAAIRIAKEQKSISLATRAEATFAEYCRQKASGLEGRGFRLPLC